MSDGPTRLTNALNDMVETLKSTLNRSPQVPRDVHLEWAALSDVVEDLTDVDVDSAIVIGRWSILLDTGVIPSLLEMIPMIMRDDAATFHNLAPDTIRIAVSTLTRCLMESGELLSHRGTLLSEAQRLRSHEVKALIEDALPKLVETWWMRYRALSEVWVDNGDFTDFSIFWMSAIRFACVHMSEENAANYR